MGKKLYIYILIFLASFYAYSQESNFAKKFSEAKNDSLFILKYPKTKIEKFTIDENNNFSYGDSLLFSLGLKEVIGPYSESDYTYYFKVTQIDSAFKVHVGNIWLSNLEMDSIERHKIANEVLSNPLLFDKYCHKYSHDKNKQYDCDLGPTYATAFVEPFATETSKRRKGDLYIVETKFGTHIVKSLSNPYFDRSRVEYIVLYIYK